MEPLVNRDPKVRLVLQDLLVPRAPLDHRVMWARLDPLVQLVQWARRVQLALQAQQAPRARKGRLVLWALQVPAVMTVQALRFSEAMRMKKHCVRRIPREALAMRILCKVTFTSGLKHRTIGTTWARFKARKVSKVMLDLRVLRGPWAQLALRVA